MKVTYSWLKDFVDLKIAPEQLAEKLTMAGLEVVSLEQAGGDFVFEIEITSNRPDWLSVLGVAREIGAICGLKLKLPRLKEAEIKIKGRFPLKISVSDKKDCSFYSARVIRDVQVGPSPRWLKERLGSLGLNSVNNIVDVTNYILFSFGHPLHAFDLDALGQGEINVRRAKTGEKIIAIDGQDKILSQEILVIAAKDRPVAVAGIMGGKETEVTFKTRNILLESAVFNPVLVRRGKQKLGLQSESAYRFERGVGLESAQNASLAGQELILKLASGRLCACKSFGVIKADERVIELELTDVDKVLGVVIPAAKVKQILNRLGLWVKIKAKNIISVKIPDFRQDLKLPVDLIEEIARIYGYAKIPQTFPAITPHRDIADKKELIGRIKSILNSLSLREVITYSLIDRGMLVKSAMNTGRNLLEILNPLSKEQEILRPTLLPSLIRCLAYNLDRQQEGIKIFEIADIFFAEADSARETLSLGIALCGTNSFLLKQGLIKDEITLLHLKGVLEVLFSRLGVRSFDFIRQDEHRVEIILDSEKAGFMLELSRPVSDSLDIKNRQVVLAEIDLEKLFCHLNLSKKFSQIPKFPAITRDISFVIKNDVSVAALLFAIKEIGIPLLRKAMVTDYYQGRQIPQGFKGLTISCVYRLEERTLIEEEVNPLHGQICSLLKERFDVKLR